MDFIVRELYLDIEISKIKGSQGGKEGGRKEGLYEPTWRDLQYIWSNKNEIK